MSSMTPEELEKLRAAMPRADMSQGNGTQQTSQSPASTQQTGQSGMSPQQAQAEYQRRMLEQQQKQQQMMMNSKAGQAPTNVTPNTMANMQQNTVMPQQVNMQQSINAQPTQPTMQPAPQPNPGMDAGSTGGTSAQQAMRARMQASRNQVNQQTQGNVMQQGDTYDPQQANNQQNVSDNQQSVNVPQQQNDIANNTIINTTDTTGQVSNPDGKKKTALIVAGVVIVLLLGLVFIITKFGGKKSDDDVTPVDEWNEDDFDWIVPEEEVFSYNTEQRDILREMGWTADEIEAAEANGTPASTLIKQAKAARNAYVQMTLAPMYDTASDEYKHFIEQTWLTLPQRDDMNEWQNIAAYYQDRKNFDYEKIDVYGKQLFIKVYLDDNLHEDWFFITVTPEEWDRLDDFGNIVVNYTYVTRYIGDDIWTAEEDLEDYYITDASIEFTN